MIFHIPHSSTDIPAEYRSLFLLDSTQLASELLLMTDHFTDELFLASATNDDSFLRFPVSRLLVDPERFPDDAQEEMSKVGMGAIYRLTHNGESLKDDQSKREELLTRYFSPHHRNLTARVGESLDLANDALIVDCHSFPKSPLPYELDQTPTRPQICIGVDEFHTPSYLIDTLVNFFSKAGLSVSVNAPFTGSIVPLDYYHSEKKVRSIMIEVRRDGYMDESTGEKSDNFSHMQSLIQGATSVLRTK